MTKANRTGLKDRILDQIPGYRTVVERERRLRTLTMQGLNAIGNASDIAVDYYEKIAQAVDSGADSLTDIRDQYMTDLNGLRARAEFHQLAVRVMQQAQADANVILSSNTDLALNILRAELDTLMTEVRKHRAVIAAHPATAEQALSSGDPKAADNWRTVTGLLGRYDEIHNEYNQWITRQDDTGRGVAFAATVIGQMARFLEAEPFWLHRRSITPAPDGGNNGPIKAWLDAAQGFTLTPEDNPRTGLWPHAHAPSQWLLMVADNEPWLPDADTLFACLDLAEDMFRSSATAGASWFYSRIAELAEHGAHTDLNDPAATDDRKVHANA